MFVKRQQVLTSSKEILQQNDASVYDSKKNKSSSFSSNTVLGYCLKSHKKTGLTLNVAALKCITLNHA